MIIDNIPVGPGHAPYVIAELSANHGGDLERAKRIIRIAAECGAQAVKFQAYTADEMTLDCNGADFVVQADTPWKGERLHSLYNRAATPYAWFSELFAYARSCGITPFASAFGPAGIGLLESLEAPAYKVASFEAVDMALLAACARTGKPVLVSTGMCTTHEIEDIVRTFQQNGGRELALLRCNSAYPADPGEANLATIPDMAERFRVPIGYSDHTTTHLQAAIAVGLGACIVEKHLIDARHPETPDSSFSSLPEQFKELVQACFTAWRARGVITYGPQPREQQSIVFRRSLYASADIAGGDIFTPHNIRAVRPGFGLAPKHMPNILGRRALRHIKRGERLSADMVEGVLL